MRILLNPNTNPHWLKSYAKKHGGTYTKKVEPSGFIMHTTKFPNGTLDRLGLLNPKNPTLKVSVSKCHICGKGIRGKKVTTGWGKEFHPRCYQLYLKYGEVARKDFYRNPNNELARLQGELEIEEVGYKRAREYEKKPKVIRGYAGSAERYMQMQQFAKWRNRITELKKRIRELKKRKNPILETIGAAAITGVGIGAGFKVVDAAWNKMFKRKNPAKPHTEVVVSRLPKCDFCPTTAQYDAKTRMGPWANMCPTHFRMYGYGLGLGRGQKLILRR